METSTVVFVITLLVAFVFLRWLITPIQQTVPPEIQEIRDHRGNRTTATTRPAQNERQRPVTDDMIQVVQAIAPQLTVSQIRYDLERSGSVEATVNRYMESGTLPFPPGESAQTVQPQEEVDHNTLKERATINLIEKYGLESQDIVEDVDNTWGKTEKERSTILNKKRQEMILKARKRLASQLSNEKV